MDRNQKSGGYRGKEYRVRVRKNIPERMAGTNTWRLKDSCYIIKNTQIMKNTKAFRARYQGKALCNLRLGRSMEPMPGDPGGHANNFVVVFFFKGHEID